MFQKDLSDPTIIFDDPILMNQLLDLANSMEIEDSKNVKKLKVAIKDLECQHRYKKTTYLKYFDKTSKITNKTNYQQYLEKATDDLIYAFPFLQNKINKYVRAYK